MTIRDAACIAGAFEHPTRYSPDKTTAQLHAECAQGALRDAGLSLQDVDGLFFDSIALGGGPLAMADYLGVQPRHVDTTDTGGSSYLIHVSHAAQAIAMGKCDVALVTMAGRPRSESVAQSRGIELGSNIPAVPFEQPYGAQGSVANYALVAARHMYDHKTTSEQLAWVKVAASHHAQYNPHAMLRDVVTVDEVLASPMIADPLHRLDCCVVSDGGGAVVVVRPEIARQLGRPVISLRGAGEAVKGGDGGRVDISFSAAAWSGPAAFAEAGVTPADIRYASIYDSFTITVLMQLEDLGFCPRGQGGSFVADGNLISGVGRLPVNTDGGGLCNNHPNNRGGMTKLIEAVRQLRHEAHPKVQVPGCELALVQGTGGLLASRHGSATLILERRSEL
jgi:acetyl-CoA C-acetyltransferase